jgi:hypothetical protein
MQLIFIFLTTTLTLYPNTIYKQLILAAVYYINLLVTAPDFYLVLAPYLVSITYKDEAIINIL